MLIEHFSLLNSLPSAYMLLKVTDTKQRKKNADRIGTKEYHTFFFLSLLSEANPNKQQTNKQSNRKKNTLTGEQMG